MVKNKQIIFLSLVFMVALILGFPLAVFAQSSSNNYKIEEYYFGTGGEVDASSANYRARQSTGSLGVGNTSSANYDAEAGFVTQSDVFLEMSVSGATVNFGLLDYSSTSSSAAQAGPCNCSFYVKSYISSDYVVVSVSQPPTSENNDNIDSKTVLGPPLTGNNIEEFGINVVSNSSPSMGANPVNQPDNSFADGQAAPGYNVPNQFKYNPGDTIVRSQATPGNPAVGLTEYTISYIMKPGINTPAGTYVMNQDLVVVATF